MPHESAPFWLRLLARVLDLAFCLVLTFVIAIPVSLFFIPVGLAAPDRFDDLLTGIYAWFCYFVAYIGLEVFLLVRRDGQSLAKGIFGLRVVPASEWARPRLEWRQAVIRMAIIFMPFVFMSLAGSNPEVTILQLVAVVGFLSLITSVIIAAIPAGKRRTLHDLATGTRVVRAAERKIHLRTDIPLMLPRRVDLRKR